MRYTDVSAYSILWADALVIEEEAVGGQAVKRATGSASRAKRVKKAGEAKTTAKKTKKKATKKKAVKQVAGKKMGGDDA
jgi:topoisomerase IA-like protein